MKRLAVLAMEGRVRRVIVGACLLVGLPLLTLAIPRSSGADPATGTTGAVSVHATVAVAKAAAQSALGATPSGGWTNPATVMGAKACIRCHRSEYLAWTESKHYKTGETIAKFLGTTKEYSEALGITQDTIQGSLCASCHLTTQPDLGGKVRAIAGVSCESCHGGAGSESGWLNRHAVYGPNITSIDQETDAHRAARIEFCEDAGMVRTARTYSIAKNCYQCHSVTNEKLVNAGHKIGKLLEVVGWTIGEVRHNFHEDQAVNSASPTLWTRTTGGDTKQRRRVKFIVGILVNLEVSLTALSTATDDDGDYVSDYRDQAVELQEDFLSEIIDYLEDDPIEGLAELLEMMEDMEIDDADYSEEEARKAAADAAIEVAKVAKSIAGSKNLKLAGVDEFMDDTIEARGEEYSRQ